MVTCNVCGAQMHKDDLRDHAIAHTISQKQIEEQNLLKIVEIEEFFEEEKLEVGSKFNEPVLKVKDLQELPCKKFFKQEAQEPQNQKETTQLSCRICMCEFEDGEIMRTTRCFHMFHKDCIDKWLTKQRGTCPICKVKQIKPCVEKDAKMESCTKRLITRVSNEARRQDHEEREYN